MKCLLEILKKCLNLFDSEFGKKVHNEVNHLVSDLNIFVMPVNLSSLSRSNSSSNLLKMKSKVKKTIDASHAKVGTENKNGHISIPNEKQGHTMDLYKFFFK